MTRASVSWPRRVTRTAAARAVPKRLMLRGTWSRIGAAVAGSSASLPAGRVRRRRAARARRARGRASRGTSSSSNVEEHGARLGGDGLCDLHAEPRIGVPAELAREPAGEARREIAERAREDRTGVDRQVGQCLMERGRRFALLLDEAAGDEAEQRGAPHGRRRRIGEVPAQQRFVRPDREVEPKHRGADLAVVVLEQAVDETEHLGPRRVREERERAERHRPRRMVDQQRRDEVELVVGDEHVERRHHLGVVRRGEGAEQHLQRPDVERRQRALEAGAEHAELLAETSDVVRPKRREGREPDGGQHGQARGDHGGRRADEARREDADRRDRLPAALSDAGRALETLRSDVGRAIEIRCWRVERAAHRSPNAFRKSAGTRPLTRAPRGAQEEQPKHAQRGDDAEAPAGERRARAGTRARLVDDR